MMIQTALSTLIIFIAALYITNLWLPAKLKQRLLQLLGQNSATKQSTGTCGSCSSCGNCGSSSTKPVKFAQK